MFGSPSQRDLVALRGPPEDVVDEALLRRVLELPDEADDGQRQDDRQVQRALVEAGEPDLLVEEHGEEDAERRGDEEEEHRAR